LIRLQLLGAVRMAGDHGPESRRVLAQPRRVALLAYLALRARHGPERRDTLLGMFWPESDTDHARGALRNALHFLRGAMGPGVIRSIGSEEVQLDLDLVSCDAVEFDRLWEAGDVEGALRLYGGDLLKGFFISESPEFEHWLDGERARIRQRAAAAARTLAAHAEAEGEPGLAILRLRDLLELSPTDEAAARDLIRLLADTDDRGLALTVFAKLQARLADEYGLEPDPETTRLAESLRAAATRPAPATRPPSEAEPGPALDAELASVPLTSAPPGPGRSASRRGLRWTRPAFLGAAAAGVLVLLAASGLLLSARSDTPSPELVAVLPFEYRGSPEHAYLAEGLAGLLAANLDGAGELRAVDSNAVLARALSAGGPVRLDAARREAAAHGAGLFVHGSITEAAGQLRITATLHGSTPRSRPAPERVAVAGDVDDALELVDRLTLNLLQGRGSPILVQASQRTTESVEALKAFLRGEAALRRSDPHGALDQYRHAAEIDSSFALAHYRLSTTAFYLGIARIPRWAAMEALRHAGRLAREDSLLVAGWHHHVNASAVEAQRLYEEALILRPDHVEVDYQLGELLYHWGSIMGVPASEAAAPFSRVLAAQPTHVQAGSHLARIAARDGRARGVDSLVALLQGIDPGGDWEDELDALRAFLSDDKAWQDWAVVRQAGRDREILEAAALTGNLVAVERVAAARLGEERTPGEQARLEVFLAHVRLARGRYHDAVRGIETASALPLPRRLEYLAMMATLPFLPIPVEELERVRRELASHPDLDLSEEGGPIAGRGAEYPHLLWPGLFRPRRLYLLGALHVRLGDITAANAVADSLGDDRQHESVTRRYEKLTRARTAGATGRAEAGLGVLGLVEPPPGRTFETLVEHGRPYERWLRAELLQASGRAAEALRWYATFPDPMARDLPYLAPSHLRRARIHEAAGALDLAALHYRRFIELWADADAELQPEVEEARARLECLRHGC
jgi:DNA-binding SARP family transcriptional activator/TolB-like protein